MIRALVFLWLVGVLVLAGTQAEARICRGEASGMGTTSSEIDSDMNGALGSVGTAAGFDYCRGRFTASSAGELADWDQVSFCDFDEYGTPSGVSLFYLSNSQVVRYQSGDLLFTELDDSQPSWFCYHWQDPNASTYEVHSILTGGTGRLTGASGHAVGTGRSYALQNMGASSGTYEMDITLPSPPRP